MLKENGCMEIFISQPIRTLHVSLLYMVYKAVKIVESGLFWLLGSV